jgi:energy-coupling factor transporter ATP-binding protein EcfA2
VTAPATGMDVADARARATAPSAIALSSVTFEYEGGHRALADIDLRIDHGEFVALMGPNGAGKTTLCLMLNGVIPNVIGGTLAGTIEIDGMRTTEHHVYELAERVGVVLQDPDAQILATNLVAEVAFAAENLGVPRETMAARIRSALDVVRLTGLEQRAPEELSGGQKQRLAIAAGLVMEPPIFVLDEPTAQLDPIGNVEVFDVLERLNRERGVTVVVATHNSEDVARVASRVIVLGEGRILADGSPREIFRQVELLDRVGINVPEVARIEVGLWPGIDSADLGLDVPTAVERVRTGLDGGALTVVPVTAAGSAEPASTTAADRLAEGRGQSGPPLVEVRDLAYSYPGTSAAALSDIDLEIRRGEFVALVGQNGSGKSTLIKCLAGLHRPTAGRLAIDGEVIDEKAARRLPRRIGVVLQNPDTQLFRMSLVDEVRFGLENIGVPVAEQDARIHDALEIAGLGHVADIYPFKLSFGDRRKVAVAAIVAMRPEILVFDEPTTGQDFRGRYQLCEIAHRLNQQGTTVVMITHDMDLVARYAARTVILGMGRVLFDGPTRAAFGQTALLRQTYLAPPQAAQVAQALADRGVRGDALSVDEVLGSIRPEARRAGAGAPG